MAWMFSIQDRHHQMFCALPCLYHSNTNGTDIAGSATPVVDLGSGSRAGARPRAVRSTTESDGAAWKWG